LIENENENIPMAQNMSFDMAGCGGFRIVVRHDVAIAVVMFVVVWQAGSAGVVIMTWLLVAAGAVVTQLAALVSS
jgi:hypothetical protein